MNKHGSGKQKKKKEEERQSSNQRELVVKSFIGLQKICKIIPEKRYYHEYNKTIWSNVYKQYHDLKRKPRKTKSLQLYEGFQLQCGQERLYKRKKKIFRIQMKFQAAAKAIQSA